MTGRYNDMLHLPHPVSKTHPQMALLDRAAQFAPFAALTGYDAAIRETARQTDERVVLDEYMKDALNNRLRILADRMHEHPEIEVTYFQPDERKQGGAYVTAVQRVKRMDNQERVIIMDDERSISIEDILRIGGQVFESMGFQPGEVE